MASVNPHTRELVFKLVFYGPGLGGKTTTLQYIHAATKPEHRGKMVSLATPTDRTLYFDFLPIRVPRVRGMAVRLQLFTVPGQVYYAETRKLVLKGTDGVVFVADSQDHMMDENRQSLRDLQENLAANGLDYNTIPLVMQWNKRDLPHLISEAELDAALNGRGVKTLSAIASQGVGALETLRHITLAVFNHIKSGGKAKRPAAGTQPVVPSSRTAQPVQPVQPPRSASATSMGNVKPGTWSAALPKTSLDREPSTTDKSPAPVPRHASVPAARAPSARAASAPLNKDGPQPVKISSDLLLDEFKNLAVMQSQFEERLTALEHEITRLGRENQEIREMLSRTSH